MMSRQVIQTPRSPGIGAGRWGLSRISLPPPVEASKQVRFALYCDNASLVQLNLPPAARKVHGVGWKGYPAQAAAELVHDRKHRGEPLSHPQRLDNRDASDESSSTPRLIIDFTANPLSIYAELYEDLIGLIDHGRVSTKVTRRPRIYRDLP